MRAIVTAALVALIAVLVFGLAPHFSSPEAHAGVIATIDQKIDNVITLTAGSAGASALISAIPGDAGSPIADKLMDLSTGFLIVLAALFWKKILISIFSGVALGIVLPLAIVVIIGFGGVRACALVRRPLRLGLKFAAIGAVLLLAISTSSWVTDRIDDMYDTSLQQSVESAEALAEGAAEAEAESGKKDEDGILGFFQGAIDTVTGGIASAAEGRKSRSTSSSSPWRSCS